MNYDSSTDLYAVLYLVRYDSDCQSKQSLSVCHSYGNISIRFNCFINTYVMLRYFFVVVLLTGCVRDRKITVTVNVRPKAIHQVVGTLYNPVSGQCDSDPLVTADGSTIDMTALKEGALRWVALSRDLLKRWGGPYDYGDSIFVYHPHRQVVGWWVVRDCMNARYKKRMDFLRYDTRNFPHVSNGVLISNVRFI